MWKCNLDVTNILIGYEEVEADDGSGLPHFDEKPDLQEGAYRWDGEKFVPAHNHQTGMKDGPDAWYALYRLCRRLEKQNVINLPAPTKTWMEYYRKSFTNDPAVEA